MKVYAIEYENSTGDKTYESFWKTRELAMSEINKKYAECYKYGNVDVKEIEVFE